MIEQQFVTFYIGEEWLGIDILLAHEVCHGVALTPVDLCPAYVRGLMNMRGKTVTVLDLAAKLGLPPRRHDAAHTTVIVLKTTQELQRTGASTGLRCKTGESPVGLQVDRIGDVVEVDDPARLEQAPAHVSGIEGYYVDKVLKLDHKLLAVLKITDVLAVPDDIQIGHRAKQTGLSDRAEKETEYEE